MVGHNEALARPLDPAPLLDPKGSNKEGNPTPSRIPWARASCLGRPGRPPGQFGLGPGFIGWVLGTGLG